MNLRDSALVDLARSAIAADREATRMRTAVQNVLMRGNGDDGVVVRTDLPSSASIPLPASPCSSSNCL